MASSSFPYKKVLMVGGTSGIGEGLAAKFVSQGISVIVVGRREEKLDSFVKTYGSDKASSSVFDVNELSKIPSWAKKIHEQHPDLDCVVLNQGVQRGFDFSKPDTVDLSVVNEEFTTNYLAVLHLTNAFLPFLQEQSKKSPAAIMFTTSGLALIPMIRCANYCASKAALHHYILALREQLKDGLGDVKCIELFPPAVQTELHDAKHQPDIKDGGKIGIPLNEYIEETWKGLSAGKEQVPVGSAAGPFSPDGFETKRQEAFFGMKKMVNSVMAKHF